MDRSALGGTASRIGHIDGLRALAVLGVVFYHTTVHMPGLRRFMVEGRHGVDLFFVISGFCLSYPTLRAIARGQPAAFDLRHFFAKRALRIAPPYWIAVTFFAALALALRWSHAAIPRSMLATTPADIVKQIFFLDYNLNFSNGSFWTLAVECRWYLLFPILLALWIRNRRAFWLVAAASYAAYHYTRLHVIDFATLPAFMAGIFAADLCISQDRRARYALFLLPVLVWYAFIRDHPIGSQQWALQDMIEWQVACFALVVAAGHNGVLRAVFSWKPLTFIGVASYSIYLYHEPIVGILTSDWGWNWLLAAAAATAAGIVAWWLVERQTQLPAVRTELLAKIDARLTPVLRFVGVPASVSLESEA